MSGNLYERLPMPSILSTGTYSIAVYSGGGSRLVKQIEALFENHDLHKALDAFGVVADADKKPPADLATKYQKAFQGLFPDFPARTCWIRGWSVPGAVHAASVSPRCCARRGAMSPAVRCGNLHAAGAAVLASICDRQGRQIGPAPGSN